MSVYDLSVPRRPVIDAEPEVTADPVPTDRRWALTSIAAVLYAIGWLLGALLVPVGLAGVWMFAAIATGWDDASTSWHRNRKA